MLRTVDCLNFVNIATFLLVNVDLTLNTTKSGKNIFSQLDTEYP